MSQSKYSQFVYIYIYIYIKDFKTHSVPCLFMTPPFLALALSPRPRHAQILVAGGYGPDAGPTTEVLDIQAKIWYIFMGKFV